MAEPEPRVDEAELVDRARGGDAGAFAVLVRRHQDPVFRLCSRMLGDRSDAEDAFQETFLRAWRALALYRAEASFGTWVYRIAVNHCYRILARRPTPRAAPFAEEPQAREASPEREVVARDELAFVEGALSALGPAQRAVVVMRHVEGLSYAEIAEVLGTTEGAVRSRLNRARRDLVRAMEQRR